MLTQANLTVFLYALPIYQLLFYTVQLISFKRKNPSRRYLGLLLLNMTIVLVLNAIQHFGYDQLMSILFILFSLLLLTLLPVFYLYLSSLAHEDREVRGLSRFSLFVFPVLCFMMSLFTFGILPLNERLMIMTGVDPTGDGSGVFTLASWCYQWITPLLFAIQLVISFIKARYLLLSGKETIRQDPGRFAYLQPGWITIIAISLILFILAVLIPLLVPGHNPVVGSLMANVILLASGGIAGYYGMKQDTLLIQVASLERARPLSVPVQETVLQKEELQGYPGQSRSIPLIPVEEARKIVKGLDKLMLTKKPFLDTRYSLSDLCLQLNTSRRVMTYVLNDVMGKNFYGVVNEYRMKEAIHIMENSGKKYTIEAIAEMVGFNSKSSFYACFKKYTGSSPKEYFENK